MLVETFPVGPLACNCTVLACPRTRDAVIVDPGDEAERILDVVRANDLNLVGLVHTHAHLDHVCGTEGVKREGGGEISLHEGDRWLYENVSMQGQLLGMRATNPPPPDRWLVDGDTLVFGDQRLDVIHTPGHTPGSICFLERSQGLIFTGDTLFAQGIGRTDLWGGSYPQIMASIQDRLMSLDDEIRVVPGHGPATRIGQERRSNPFLKG